MTSCFSDVTEGKTKNFYASSHKAADIIRIPIIEPFELTNPVALYHEAWYVDYPRDIGMEEMNIYQEDRLDYSHKYICVFDSVFYTICLNEGDTCFWIYDIQNKYQFCAATSVGFNAILKEVNYPNPKHWDDIDRLWIDFNETQHLPWRTYQNTDEEGKSFK